MKPLTVGKGKSARSQGRGKARKSGHYHGQRNDGGAASGSGSECECDASGWWRGGAEGGLFARVCLSASGAGAGWSIVDA